MNSSTKSLLILLDVLAATFLVLFVLAPIGNKDNIWLIFGIGTAITVVAVGLAVYLMRLPTKRG